MDVTLGIIFFTVFLISFFVLRRPKNLPPGPFSLPLLGSIFFVKTLPYNRPHLIFAEAAKKYGNVMSFWVGPSPVVVISGYDMVYESLVKYSDSFSGRPLNIKLLLKAFHEDGDKGRGVLLNDYTSSWRTMRRFTLQVLRDFGVGKTSIEEKVFTEIDAVEKRLDKLQGQPTDIHSYMQNIISNVIFGVVFGNRYEYEDPQFESVSKITKIAVEGRGPLSLIQFLPEWLVKIINKEEVENFNNQVESFRQMRKYVIEQIDEHEATFDRNNIRDFVDLYLRNFQDADEAETRGLDKQDMFRVIIDLFLAGSETTSGALDWAFLYMIQYPEIQRKCYKAISEVFGDKNIHYADRNKLVYIEATLLEVQRHATILPINVFHCTTKDVRFHGYDIPKNTLILPTLYSVMYDTKYWTDPHTFRPERFIDNTGKLIKHDAMIPFGIGPRQCLGEPLAKVELFLVFANLIQRFEFKRDDPAVKHTLESVPERFTNSPLPYKLRVYRRA